MQTFLPYSSFMKSARVLDNKRLGKQRVECLQILQTLQKKKENPNAKIAWANHPIVKMWEGYEDALFYYHNRIILEWKVRGFKDNTFNKVMDIVSGDGALYSKVVKFYMTDAKPLERFPKFIGNIQFHLSHQSNLLRKDFNHYSKYFKNVPDNLPYKWYNPKTGEFYEIYGVK